MVPVQPETPRENNEELRRVLARLDDVERRLHRLERRVDASTPAGWPCTACKRGWVVERGDVLACNRCSFRRHL